MEESKSYSDYINKKYGTDRSPLIHKWRSLENNRMFHKRETFATANKDM
ncbi:hypothetical protein [Oceanobacillus jordanicus]|uniref:Uncharacterized protein n=1 Tax=Oceanobacillus jordanicus TaxID=2867266 RepID=A0AAW5BA88_9BACI|nr:hypothetical protein [Oceanobacillus jordanicus]MCG3421266.1 hypothetical protein [Oceanobacillus jordanicus]